VVGKQKELKRNWAAGQDWGRGGGGRISSGAYGFQEMKAGQKRKGHKDKRKQSIGTGSSAENCLSIKRTLSNRKKKKKNVQKQGSRDFRVRETKGPNTKKGVIANFRGGLKKRAEKINANSENTGKMQRLDQKQVSLKTDTKKSDKNPFQKKVRWDRCKCGLVQKFEPCKSNSGS